jgi:hypothetical protein
MQEGRHIAARELKGFINPDDDTRQSPDQAAHLQQERPWTAGITRMVARYLGSTAALMF